MTVNDGDTGSDNRDPHDQRRQRRPDVDTHLDLPRPTKAICDGHRQWRPTRPTPRTPTNNDPLTYTLVVTKDNVAYASGVANIANFQVVDNGVYVVTMTVNDGEHGSDTETHTINVANSPRR